MNAERTPAKGDGSPSGQGGGPGEGFDWGRLGQRSDRRTREGRPRLDGGGEAERGRLGVAPRREGRRGDPRGQKLTGSSASSPPFVRAAGGSNR